MNNPKAYDFTGSIPAHYDQYLGPLFFEPFAIEIAKRIDAASVLMALEIASGTGRVTHHLREVLSPKARLVASDISPDMLAIAKEKLKNEDIEWRIIDAQDLPFEENSLDLVVCCFGYMFVPDKEKAFSEAYRVLRPGGMLILTTWDKLETIGVSAAYRHLVKNYLTETLPETFNLPFSMSDDSAIKEMLLKTGFPGVVTEKLKKTAVATTATEAAEGLTQGGVIYNELMSRNPLWVEEIKQKLARKLAENYGESPMISPMSAVICQAWK